MLYKDVYGMENNYTKVGLFGTCGESLWRDRFVETYKRIGIDYFNPVVNDWKPENAEIEAKHLANDSVILFPITGETYGLGSLSEVGFSILNAINLNNERQFVIMIDQVLSSDLLDEKLKKASLTSRALVLAHLKQLNFSNVYFVNNLDVMLSVSIELYKIELAKQSIRKLILAQ